MSSMLEQAIIDAKLLRETARKNAEAKIINEWEDKIKKGLDLLLEQDEESATDPMAGLDIPDESSDNSSIPATSSDLGSASTGPVVAEPPPSAKKVVDKIPPSYLGGDNLQEIEINLDSLVEKIDELQKDLNMAAPVTVHQPSPLESTELSESVQEEELDEGDFLPTEENLEEEVQEEELDEELEEEIKEEMTVDIADPRERQEGGINWNHSQRVKDKNIILALDAQNEELQEQLNSKVQELDMMESKLQGMLTKLQETKGKLKKSVELNVQLKEAFNFLTGKISEVNLINSRLLYTNKILGNSSLNERQKKQIAESISNSKSVEEAKTIYETLQRTAQTVVERRTAPQSLTEAVSRTTTPFLPRNNQPTVDPVAHRWQIIAGIKK